MKTKKNSLRAILLALCVSVLLGAVASEPAQSQPPEGKKEKPYALIFGTVFDSRQLAVYGAHVKVRRADKKKPVWDQISDHHGEFAAHVPPGPADYLVSVEVKGPHGPAKHEKTVHVDADEREDVYLHLDEGEVPK